MKRRPWIPRFSVRFLKGGQASIALAPLEKVLGHWDTEEYGVQLQVLLHRKRRLMYFVPALRHLEVRPAPGCIGCFIPLLRGDVIRFRAGRILEALQLTPPVAFKLILERKRGRLRIHYDQPLPWIGGSHNVIN